MPILKEKHSLDAKVFIIHIHTMYKRMSNYLSPTCFHANFLARVNVEATERVVGREGDDKLHAALVDGVGGYNLADSVANLNIQVLFMLL